MDVGDVRNVNHLPREATGNKWSQPKREAMWTENGKAMWGCPSPLELAS
jgi:hypothetical protein